MVFPPSRKLPESRLRPDQFARGRREPQVDLAELSEKVHPDTSTSIARTPVRPIGNATRDFSSRDNLPGHPDHAGDDDIPTLTEVVQVLPDEVVRVPPDHGAAPGVSQPGLDPHQTEEVLERLLRRSDVLLEAPLQHALVPVMERLSGIVARELHDSLERIVREVVARAVNEELTRLRSEITDRDRSSRRT